MPTAMRPIPLQSHSWHRVYAVASCHGPYPTQLKYLSTGSHTHATNQRAQPGCSRRVYTPGGGLRGESVHCRSRACGQARARRASYPQDRVLEVATGPGYVAMGFAAVAREVVGVDLTEAPLAIAEKPRQEQGLPNVRFQLADASRLPFADGEFDVVVCRLAFHHFAEPPRMLGEMVRVCTPQGTVAVEDIVVSEHS